MRSPLEWSVVRRARRLVSGRRQLEHFDTLLARANAPHPRFDETALAQALSLRAGARRPRPAAGSPLGVIGYGFKHWEANGYWQAVERLGDFDFVDFEAQYAPLRAAGQRVDEGARFRDAMDALLLERVDARERAGRPVHLVVIYTSGVDLGPRAFAGLRARGIWTVLLCLDDKQMLPGRPMRGLSGWQLEAARAVDLYWTTWRAGIDWLASEGARPWYAGEAADPAFFRPVEGVARDIDVLWLGGGYGARFELVEGLRRRGIAVHTRGPGWPEGAVDFAEMIRLFSRAHVVLGMSGVGQFDAIKTLKGRDFEVPMAGAVYLTSYNPELADHFDIGREVLCYAGVPDCAETLIHLRQRPERAQSIRAAARARALRDHTWDARFERILALLGLR